jgi:2-oxoisovalerate dehydrogenase E1 component alpha subunit
VDLKDTQAGHAALGLSDDELLRMYNCMLLARRVDERMWILNRQGKAAFVISCQGQEAAQIGTAYSLRPGYDYVYPYYRDFGITLFLGQTPRDQFLSLLGKKEDPNSAGRQMPGHYSSRELNIVTASAPVGVQYPQATGTALAFKMRGEDGVVLACGGEVDGNDVLAVYEAAKVGFERAREGEGPTLIEAKTYRVTAHSSDDDDRRYREREEIEGWRQKDPVLRYEKYLEEAGLLDEGKKEEIATRIKGEVDEAVGYAENAPYADPEEALERVYAEG